MSARFVPATWLPGPHAQTVGARLLRRFSLASLRRERLQTPDGDFIDLDWAGGPRAERSDDGRPIVVVLHGLEGSARSGYAIQLYRALGRRGLAAVGMNFRSCSGEPNRLPRAYHFGETGDLEFVVETLSRRHPTRRIGAAGFSCGGSVLLKHLGEKGDSARVVAAVAVSVPFDLHVAADNFEQGIARAYQAYLVRRLRRKLRAKAAQLEGRVDVRGGLGARSFREFDRCVTAPLYGFADAEDYYTQSSAARYLDRVGVPTLLIQALDDPFFPGDSVPRGAALRNPRIEEAFVPGGGHVGFVSGPPWAPRFWAEEQAADFLATRLGPVRAPPP